MSGLNQGSSNDEDRRITTTIADHMDIDDTKYTRFAPLANEIDEEAHTSQQAGVGGFIRGLFGAPGVTHTIVHGVDRADVERPSRRVDTSSDTDANGQSSSTTDDFDSAETTVVEDVQKVGVAQSVRGDNTETDNISLNTTLVVDVTADPSPSTVDASGLLDASVSSSNRGRTGPLCQQRYRGARRPTGGASIVPTSKGGGREGLRDYKDSEHRRYWMPDDGGKECYECEASFTTFRRRHHCRICGQIFCARCCGLEVSGHMLGYSGTLRACGYCAHSVLQQARKSAKGTNTSSSPSSSNVQAIGRQLHAVTKSASLDSIDASIGAPGSPTPSTHIPQTFASPTNQQPAPQPTDVSTISGGLQWPSSGDNAHIDSSSVPSNEVSPSNDRKMSTISTVDDEPDWVRGLAENRLKSPPTKTSSDSPDGTPQHTKSARPLSQLHVMPLFSAQTIVHDALQSPSLVVEGEEEDKESVSSESSVCSRASASHIYALLEHRCIALLRHCVQREELSSEWMSVLWPMLEEVAHAVTPDVKGRRDHMDILAYVHVKRIVSSQATQPRAQVVFGTVFGQSVCDRRMAKQIGQPTVALIQGGVEYERTTNKLSTLEPILRQETDYLKNLTTRIIQMRPSIVCVEKNVARTARKFLLDAGVTLVCNIKPHVMKRIARCTQAQIIQSVDAQTSLGRLGNCGEFYTRDVRCVDGRVQSLMYFDHCPPDLSAAIILQHHDRRQLVAVKRIVRYMLSVLQSAKLESELLRMDRICLAPERHALANDAAHENPAHDTKCAVCVARKPYEIVEEANAMANGVENDVTANGDVTTTPRCTPPETLKDAARNAVLVSSPLLTVTLPYLEREGVKEACALMPFFKQPMFPFGRSSVTEDKNESTSPPAQTAVVSDFVAQPLTSRDYSASLASYRANGARQFKHRLAEERVSKTKEKRRPAEEESEGGHKRHGSGAIRDVLSPFHHQRIVVLFGSYSPISSNAPVFCVRPWVVLMQFYGRNDMPLGEFLTRYCFNSSYECPSASCDVSMVDHKRKIVHGRAQIEISTTCVGNSATGDRPNVDADGQIRAWHWCQICKQTSGSEPMPVDVWHMSFGKYLDYLFNAQHIASHLVTPSSSRTCPHCLYHQHEHLFSYNNYVVRFNVTPITLYEINFAPTLCALRPFEQAASSVVGRAKHVSEKSGTVFSAMLEQLVHLRGTVGGTSALHAHVERLSDIQRTGQENVRARQCHVQEWLTSFAPLSSTSILSNDERYLRIADSLTASCQIIAASVVHWNYVVGEVQQMVKVQSKAKINDTASSKELAFNERSRIPSGPTVPTLLSTDALHDDAKSIEGQSSDEVGEPLSIRVPSAPADATPVLIPIVVEPPSAEVNGQSAADVSMLRPIPPPFDLSEHYSLPPTRLPIVVTDNDLGSIIAYALTTPEYEQKRIQLRRTWGEEGVPVTLKMSSASEGGEGGADQHLEVEFADNTTKYYCKIYYAEHFRLLRKLMFADGEDAFVRSISQSRSWEPKGGKSGMSFWRTSDRRFIFKQISRLEMQSFLDFAPNYFHYLSTAATENKLTALAKKFGVFRIGYRNSATGAAAKMDVFAMEYLFYERNVKQVYDFKGSLRNRMASEKPSSDLVLLDENFLRELWTNQFYLHAHSKAALNRAISNDSHFLAANDVMDYSLLVGVDEESDELILGIVDYMRTYTLDKKFESWVKMAAVPGGHLPTVISPQLYCTRFSEAIETYFAVVPDQWAGLAHGITF